jgi:uncharacterized NAD-dependent epimerase/dehydratase family protein
MGEVPAMSRDEVEEFIENLSTHIGLTEALADDMLDAGHVVTWAANEANVDEETAQSELEEVVGDLETWIGDELADDRDVEMIVLGLWTHIQELERRLSEAPTEEDDGPDNPHDRMFY